MNEKTIRLIAGAALLAVATGCDRDTESADGEREVELETRTFTLTGVGTSEASNIIDAYVYSERPGNPGAMSADRNMISVRETADNLDRIARVVADLNAGVAAAPEGYVLHFQLVEANGATGTDPGIADVEAELRRVLRFDGYRLLGEAFVTTTGGAIDHPIPDPDSAATFSIRGDLSRAGYDRSGHGRRIISDRWELSLQLLREKHTLLRSTVNVRTGQTVVLGSARTPDFWVDRNEAGEEIPAVRHPGSQVILVLRTHEATADRRAAAAARAG